MNADQPTPATEDNVNAIRVEAGTILKQKREELGLSQKQIADRLRLRVALIEQIENNHFEADQVATFTRGYLRSYAKVVGVDEDLVLSALDECLGSQPQEQPMKSFSRKTNRERHDSRIMALTWGIVAVIVAISSVWWWQNQQKDVVEVVIADEPALVASASENAPDIQTESVADAENALATEEPVGEVDSLSPAEPVTTDAVDTEINNESDAVQADNATITEEITPPAAEIVSTNLMTMAFSDDCWIQVKDATGKTLETGIKKAGQTLQVEGKKPYKVILGAPENVSITLASEPVDLSGYTSGKVARFTLP
ncbi:RodZ domain-containing protein [Vibrio renipiscarius]|uniref:Transcriptional regulator n=1 Tax=Vibrio renipiscarius TaxID=1461322 RepID=A0A0C2P171_9VIBR|nr:RodZ domain-containing protein [Vibrio renipiscarius]KII80207.1 transcriptional regulator [Vibrio renipiscarius]KII82073.1 transcriptional regulator [Vibrio renipiscarius]